MSVLVWVVIAALIFINALYVAAEFAAVGTRRNRVRLLAQEGDRRAAWVLPIVEDGPSLDRYVAACQIGITFASLVLGAVGQATLARSLAPVLSDLGGWDELVAQSIATIVVLVILTSLQVILGELLPKSLALQFPSRVLLYTVPPMRASLRLFAWFIWLLNGSGLALLRLLRAPQVSHRHIHSPEEIDLLIAESRDGGLLEPDEQRRLHQALRLSMYPVSRVMVPKERVVAIDVERSFEEAVSAIVESPYTRLPVYRDAPDQVVGVLQTKDVALAAATHDGEPRIEELMRPLVAVPASTRADQLLTILRERRSQQAIVLDETGAMAGLVTIEDVLEEVFGEVSDEFKGGEPRRAPARRLRLHGPSLRRKDGGR
jgi:putative hemolysin